MQGDSFGQLLYLGLLLVALAGWVFSEYRGKMGQGLRTLMAWGMIFLGVMAGYGLWQDLRSTVASSQKATLDSIEVPRSPDGHYYLVLSIDGKDLRFMVDTGASGVVLSQDDARSLGIDMESLVYSGESSTANGTVRTARVRLQNVTLGPFQDESLGAWVNQGQMDGSLLGMDYLGLFAIEIIADRLVLRR
jgi:aspartyl protease family protein